MLATLFTGCGAGGKEDKGDLNLYTWDGMFPQEILDGFEKETGIRINYSNFDYDEDMLAKLEETKGGDYDLVIADDYIIELAIQEGLAQKLDTGKISTYDNTAGKQRGQHGRCQQHCQLFLHNLLLRCRFPASSSIFP